MKNLFRDEYGQIGGVCKGLSNYCEIDESIMRIIGKSFIFYTISNSINILIYVDNNTKRK